MVKTLVITGVAVLLTATLAMAQQRPALVQQISRKSVQTFNRGKGASKRALKSTSLNSPNHVRLGLPRLPPYRKRAQLT